MRARETVATALSALRSNKMRSALTTLGIVIGIAAVIAMMELGEGSSAAIRKTMESMGANNIIVQPGSAASSGVSFGAGTELTLTVEDAEAIAEGVSAVAAVAPVVRARTQVVARNLNWVPQTIFGTTPSFLAVRQWEELAQGTMFTEQDVRAGTQVAVIGQTIARELFAGSDPIGRELRIQNVPFRVIGVLSRKGANMMGSDQDDIVLAPWTAIKFRVQGSSNQSQAASATSETTNTQSSLYPSTKHELYPTSTASGATNSARQRGQVTVDQILAAATSEAAVSTAIEQMTGILRERHRIHPNDADDFNLRDMAEITKALTSTSVLMTRLLLGVAMISLAVGGVGIMNIMLVSVTERTKEIGLRMAVGARPKDILAQFLTESIVLCLLGGALGILLGKGITAIIGLILKWPTQASLSTVIVSVVVSGTVGIAFGFYPAWKAARLDPIVALRYE